MFPLYPEKHFIKTASKLTLHHMGKIFINSLTEIKFEIWRVTFLKIFLPLKNYGIDFLFPGNNGKTECKTLMRQGIGVFVMFLWRKANSETTLLFCLACMYLPVCDNLQISKSHHSFASDGWGI